MYQVAESFHHLKTRLLGSNSSRLIWLPALLCQSIGVKYESSREDYLDVVLCYYCFPNSIYLDRLVELAFLIGFRICQKRKEKNYKILVSFLFVLLYLDKKSNKPGPLSVSNRRYALKSFEVIEQEVLKTIEILKCRPELFDSSKLAPGLVLNQLPQLQQTIRRSVDRVPALSRPTWLFYRRVNSQTYGNWRPLKNKWRKHKNKCHEFKLFFLSLWLKNILSELAN
ncbi:hypothetical protein F4703DRAFT_1339128 [Phycomyces blakesleeanus]